MFVEKYEKMAESSNFLVTVSKNGRSNETFSAELRKWTWNSEETCLYAGDSEGGVPYERQLGGAPQEVGIIEGSYKDYIVNTLYSTDFAFSRFVNDSSLLDGQERFRL